MSIILSSAYHAPIQYYTKFLCNTSVIIEQNETYIKQSYRNRCVINTADGAMPLSVPVVFSASERTKMKDVGISEHDNWQHTHWNAIVSAYNSSPFFEYYRDDYEMDSSFYPTPYYQTFGAKNEFIPNLSILDLLFNMGNESLLVLLSSIKE